MLSFIKKLLQNIKKRRSVIILAIIFINILIDQISKFLVRVQIDEGEIVHILKESLLFIRAENTGAALGLGGNLPSNIKTIYLQILPIIVLLYFLKTILVKTEISKPIVLGLSLAIGGAFGNIIDRVLYGSVTDFIQVNLFFLKTGIFNMGDISIIFGVLLVLFELSFNKNNNLMDSL
jgi:signal peptidase II